ncbi:MAG: cupin domain-containing protein [Polaromonas sp.]|nr:MAG: cupin domain-containing protein [Polaromonas sp.]
MDVNQPLLLLAGLTPAQFMRRHWQKKPLLVRGALPDFKPLLSRPELFRLAAQEGVESRLIVQSHANWRMTQGPFAPRSLPALSLPAWTLLVQGVDLHAHKAHQLLQQFRFIPDARLDDLMVSFATPGGGVGPHFDSYDVFLLQASGRRRWKISRQKDLTLQPDAPLKILQNFAPEEEFVLDAGDMLYLPPRYAHEGVAEEAVDSNGKAIDCMTYSVGFRAPAKRELAAELLHRLAEFSDNESEDEGKGDKPSGIAGQRQRAATRYRDPDQMATATPGAMPQGLAAFATQAVFEALQDPQAVACALGEYMTELKSSVWFDEVTVSWAPQDRVSLCLAPQTRMLYDTHHVFINGESYLAKGADARLMQRLADQRKLTAAELVKASPAARSLLTDWHDAGWLVAGL